MNRIISKEKEREDIQGEILQRPHSNSNPRVSSEDPRRDSSFYMQSSILQINSIYRINSTRNTKLILCRLTPAAVPRVSKHSTWQNQGSKCPTVFQAPSSNSRPYSTSRLPVILPGRNSILHGSQPTRSPSSNSQAHATRNPLSIY